jgi:Sulfotransferase domain.
MSNFAERLGKLKDAMNDKTDSGPTANQKKRRKRPQTETTLDAEFPKKRLLSRPHDFLDLNVKVSFLCIGAQKSGTTWLHVMLKKLPMLCLPDQKEVHFWDWNRRKGLKWYSQQFPKRSNSVLCGEITPCYAILDDAQVSFSRCPFCVDIFWRNAVILLKTN